MTMTPIADHKPLPKLPTSDRTQDLLRLSVQSREHRERFIRFVLSELDDPWLADNLEEWTQVLEDALDDLGISMGQGNWLSGIKKSKTLKKRQSKKRKLDEKPDMAGTFIGSGKSKDADQMPVNGLISLTSKQLKQLREVVAEPDVPSRPSKYKHLLLCLAPFGNRDALYEEDSGLNMVPSTFGCSFQNSFFVLPEDDNTDGILYGLNEWDTSAKELPMRLVGGTFTLKGLPSLQQYLALSKALKLAIYVHLSLLLEQHLLVNSHAYLTFAQPRIRAHTHTSHASSQPSPVPNIRNSNANNVISPHRSRHLIPSGILSFFSKRSLGRNPPSRDAFPVRSSMDSVTFPSVEEEPPIRSSIDDMSAAARLREFSFLSSSQADPEGKNSTSMPFSATLARIESQKNVLSSSAGVVFDPPMFLVRLAEKEKTHPEKRLHLMGDERVSLSSLLGWGTADTESNNRVGAEKDKGSGDEINEGSRMTGICGFVNQQEISVLVSSHIPLLGAGVPQDIGPEASTSASTSSALSLPREVSSSSQNSQSSESSSTTINPSSPKIYPTHTSCEQPHWTVYRYYADANSDPKYNQGDYLDDVADNYSPSPAENQDKCLGEVITSWTDEADVPCSRLRTVHSAAESRGGIGIMHGLGGSASTTTEKQCEVQIGKHERRFVHGGVRISANIEWPTVESPSAMTMTPATSTVTANHSNGSSDDGIENDRLSLDVRKIIVWESCSICGAETKKNELSDGAYLFSFAKYLELLIYSPLICKLSPRLCEHTDPSSTSSPSTSSSSHQSTKSELPPQRLNIIRHFTASPRANRQNSIGGGNEYTVSFKVDPIEDIFELRVPRLQITPWGVGVRASKGNIKVPNLSPSTTSTSTHKEEEEEEEERYANKDEEEKKNLRREIKAWWEGVADHMDLLEVQFSAEDQVKKALPRLPSLDDAYDSFDDDNVSEWEGHPPSKPKISSLLDSLTPVAVTATNDYFNKTNNPLASLDSSTPSSSSSASVTPTTSHPPPPQYHAASSSSHLTPGTVPYSVSSSSSSIHSIDVGGLADPINLLSNLRQTFHRIEQTLYTQLAKTPPSSYNEVRRAFLSAARGAERRLVAWQKKHLGNTKGKKKKGRDGQNEFNLSENLRVAEPEWWNPTCHVVPGGNIIVREDDWGSIIAFTLSTPDYHRELAAMSVVGSSSSIEPDTPMAPSTSASSFFSAATATGYKLFRTSTLVQPDPDQEDVIWHEPESYSAVICRKEHPRDPTSLLSIREVLRQKSPDSNILIGSRFASIGSSTAKISNGGDRPSMFPNGVPPSAWARPDVQVSKQEVEGEVASGVLTGRDNVHRMLHELEMVEAADINSKLDSSISGNRSRTTDTSTVRPSSRAPSILDDALIVPNHSASTSHYSSANAQSSSASLSALIDVASPNPAKTSLSSLTNSITNAMRLVLPTQITRPLSADSNRHHGLLTAAEVSAIDERPHIKYDWTIGKRLKFSCTAYYAKQFDTLRKRCGVDSIFVESLSRSANWSAEGGKSKSNFWKTADDRFIIKTLVNAWNVADLQVLIELSPSYFEYMDSTASKATVLAKLMGFYTVEIRNLETGVVQSKADLLVMENLFYGQKIDKAFDLKGIQGRKVKAGNNATTRTSKTLFDGEWIEGQQQTLTLVRPHSKAVLREAVWSDAEFLSKSNIMDYSLLLGVDNKHKQIACGLVDTIGSYTFAKTLEYKAKQGLNSGNGKEVTVIPPAEYRERFTNALDKYFLACPDKWSRPIDGRKLVSDPNLLPSVL
ncbi:hypothetical protein J3R30DRAFT_137416 [Lentinula aciculospora]|uniref:PIPK domain-containing protein n=1 Tax=Lentinula aciculospora TaxID=153920 RepID=A0A9W9DX90_9AGAR|nr:hypothetical protein J3R30DRAFT_137416 [Lentinula aciculospora]